MTSTVVVRSVSGVLFEMDVPAAGHARERWDGQIANGELTVVTDPVVWVEVPGGGARLQLAATAPVAGDMAATAVRRGRPPKVTDAALDAAPDVEE